MLALYLLGSVLSACCAWRGSRTERSWWLAITIMLIAILTVRAAEPAQWLDGALQQWLHALGWYDHRRPIQMMAIALAVLFLIAIAALMRARTRGIRRPAKCAAAAMFLLLVLAAIRGSSLHWTDAILEQRIATAMFSHLLQAALLVVITASALWTFAERSGGAVLKDKQG